MEERRPRADAERAEAHAARSPDRVLRAASLWMLGLAAVAFVYNLVTTLRTVDRYPGARFAEVFFATGGDDAFASAWFTTIVWGPFALLALAAALLLVSLLPALRRRTGAQR